MYKTQISRGTWVAQSVKRPTSAQVMISRSVSSSPASGSVLTARSLEPVSDSVSPSLLLPCSCSVSVSKINVKKIFLKRKKSIHDNMGFILGMQGWFNIHKIDVTDHISKD